jgi:hypothetical protein
MALVKDDKDWTWVLDRPCPECGLNSRTLDRADIAPIVRSSAAAWQPVLSSAAVRDRPAPDVWSALEYGCHVRDVFVLFDERLLTHGSPTGTRTRRQSHGATGSRTPRPSHET